MCKALILSLCCILGITDTQIYDVNSIYNPGSYGNIYSQHAKHNRNQLSNKRPRPEIRVFFESKCPDCIQFHRALTKAVQLLGSHLDIYTYPYGNAKTYDFGNGTIVFQCQHGPEEAYGNKLHACAINTIPNYQKALIFSGYLMEMGSTDAAVDRASAMMGVSSEPIKYCAKTQRGSELLKYYGIQSHAQNFNWVPYVLLNGVQWSGSNEAFLGDLCAAFTNPPAQCRPYL